MRALNSVLYSVFNDHITSTPPSSSPSSLFFSVWEYKFQLVKCKWNWRSEIKTQAQRTCSLLGSRLVIIVLVVICNKLIKLFSLNQRDAIYLHSNKNKSNTDFYAIHWDAWYTLWQNGRNKMFQASSIGAPHIHSILIDISINNEQRRKAIFRNLIRQGNLHDSKWHRILNLEITSSFALQIGFDLVLQRSLLRCKRTLNVWWWWCSCLQWNVYSTRYGFIFGLASKIKIFTMCFVRPGWV